MKLKRFLLRYYPPGRLRFFLIHKIFDLIIFFKGIILEYEQQNVLKTKSIDLLDLKSK